MIPSPDIIDVLIEGYDNTVAAHQIKGSQSYAASLYEGDGKRFWLDWSYIQECKRDKKAPVIPLSVIKAQEELELQIARARGETGSGIIIP